MQKKWLWLLKVLAPLRRNVELPTEAIEKPPQDSAGIKVASQPGSRAWCCSHIATFLGIQDSRMRAQRDV